MSGDNLQKDFNELDKQLSLVRQSQEILTKKIESLLPAIESLTNAINDVLVANERRDGERKSLFANDQRQQREINDNVQALKEMEKRLDKVDGKVVRLGVTIGSVGSIIMIIVQVAISKLLG